MADVVFDTYLDHLVQLFWPTAAIHCAVFEASGWTPSKSDVFLADAIGAGAVECAASGYARVPLTSPIASLDGAGHRSLLQSAVADFGTLGAGTNFDTFVLYVAVTNDSDSWMMATYDVGAQTTDGTELRFVPDTDGLMQLRQP